MIQEIQTKGLVCELKLDPDPSASPGLMLPRRHLDRVYNFMQVCPGIQAHAGLAIPGRHVGQGTAAACAALPNRVAALATPTCFPGHSSCYPGNSCLLPWPFELLA